MPELPEVETVRRGLSSNVVGKKFKEIEVRHERATSKNSIAPISSLKGAKVIAVRRRGKFMWFELNRPEVLVAHLGMSGQFLIQPKKAKDEKHLRVRFKLKDGELRFIDQRTFGWLSVEELKGGIPTSASHIALDPFDPDFDLSRAVASFKSKKTQVKKALLDQAVISGVGNIYADESLWRAKIHPETRIEKLGKVKVEELLTAASQVMSEALAQGGTSFDDLYINVNGESGYFERSLSVYGQEGEPCPRCGALVKRISFSNRSSHFCPKCQPTPRKSGS
jgi:formamidopyrimidine-DNA glycosylase